MNKTRFGTLFYDYSTFEKEVVDEVYPFFANQNGYGDIEGKLVYKFLINEYQNYYLSYTPRSFLGYFNNILIENLPTFYMKGQEQIKRVKQNSPDSTGQIDDTRIPNIRNNTAAQSGGQEVVPETEVFKMDNVSARTANEMTGTDQSTNINPREINRLISKREFVVGLRGLSQKFIDLFLFLEDY